MHTILVFGIGEKIGCRRLYSSALSHDQSDPQTVVLDIVGSFSQVLRCPPDLGSLGQWAQARSAADLTCWGRSAEYAAASAR
jgi:hypothetical protein